MHPRCPPAVSLVLLGTIAHATAGPPNGSVRIATFNLWDVSSADLAGPDQPRLRRLAAVIQAMEPDVLLLNEIAWDSGALEADGTPGDNGQRFADLYLARSQGPGLEPIRFVAFAAPSNTGIASGLDLDNNGTSVARWPEPRPSDEDGEPAAQTAAGRAYGNDCWGFGTYPGQYAMALLVRQDLALVADEARTFQRLPWNAMPGSLIPDGHADAPAWYDAREAASLRLSSKSHWDVPVRLPDGRIVHVLVSHPTPPAFDGTERRNARRNHDEIRFWADYLDGADYIVDDRGERGGLPSDALFVIVGDLNADPDEGSSMADPVGTYLLSNPRIRAGGAPTSDVAADDLNPDDTAHFGLRVDYVLASKGLDVVDRGVWRETPSDGGDFPSDHFPVWIDVRLEPAPSDPRR